MPGSLTTPLRTLTETGYDMTEIVEIDTEVQTVNGPERVAGYQLGSSTSQRQRHNHIGDFVAAGTKKCSACRWMEVLIVWNTEKECYTVVTIGRTRVPGEMQRCRVEHTSSPLWVIETLLMPSDSGPRLSMTARKAVVMAARADADVMDAYRQRQQTLL